MSAIDCLLIDLDDTIYPEAEYFRVIFDEFCNQLKLDRENVHSFMVDFAYHRRNSPDIFGVFLRSIGLWSESNRDCLFNLYKTVTMELLPYPGVNDLMRTCTENEIRVVVLTNGIAAAQENKWRNLNIDEKLSFCFQATRLLGQDKPSAETFEKVRSQLGFGWEHILTIGDSYEKDIAYPTSRGALGILVGNSENLPKDSGAIHVGVIADAIPLIKMAIVSRADQKVVIKPMNDGSALT